MIQQTIHNKDPITGSEIAIPRDVLEGIQLAKTYLETELIRFKSIPIDAEWIIRNDPNGKLEIQFSLTTQGGGIAEVPYPVEVVRSPTALKSSLRRDMWYFTTNLMTELERDIKKLKSELVLAGTED